MMAAAGKDSSMPYPPRPPRKHATNEEAQAARSKALQPYQYQPGQSGNREGFGATRRAQLNECERLACAEGPQSIARLAWLRDNSPDDRVQTRAAEILLSRLPSPRAKDDKGLADLPVEELRARMAGLLAWMASLKVPASETVIEQSQEVSEAVPHSGSDENSE